MSPAADEAAIAPDEAVNRVAEQARANSAGAGRGSAESTALLEIAVPVGGELVEPVFELFERHGGGAVIELIVRGPESGYDDPQPQTWVRTYLPLHDAEARLRVEIGLWHLGQIYPMPEAIVRELAEANWAEAWKAHYTPQPVGPFLVVPSWIADADALASPAAAAASATSSATPLIIRLDPGMAFGTGQHPTTRLCLLALAELVRPGDRVLDVGIGSGILAIGAGLVGAGQLVGVDIDPRAADTAAANAAANGVAVDARAGSLDVLDVSDVDDPSSTDATDTTDTMAPFDIVVGNLLAPTVVALAEGLAAWTRPGGLLIASGILVEQADEVSAALVAAGFDAPRVDVDGDWVALVCARGARDR